MSLKENATTIAENVPKVYEAGKKAEWNTLWDSLQNNGNRVAYGWLFSYWNEKAFYPKYNIKLGGSSSVGEQRSAAAFRSFNTGGTRIDLASRLEECGVRLDTSTCNDFIYMFMQANVTRLPEIDVSASTQNMYMTFYTMPQLVTIDKIISGTSTSWQNNTFKGTTKLENLTVDGTIGKNNFNVSYCTLLSHESLISILNALKDYSQDTSGTVWKVTLGTENYAKLSNEELAIAEEKGWVVE